MVWTYRKKKKNTQILLSETRSDAWFSHVFAYLMDLMLSRFRIEKQ